MTPWTAAHQASLSITTPRVYSNSCPLIPSNHLILCRPLLLLPSIFPSIRVFSNESALHIRWPKYWSFSLYTDKYAKPKVVPILKKTWEKLDFQTSAHRGLRQEQVTLSTAKSMSQEAQVSRLVWSELTGKVRGHYQGQPGSVSLHDLGAGRHPS